MTTQAAVINYTPTTSVSSLLNTLKTVMLSAGYSLQYDGIAGSSRFIVSQNYGGAGRADENMIVEVLYTSNRIQLRTAEAIVSDALSGTAYNMALATTNSVPLYLGEYGLLWFCAGNGFVWLASKDQYGITRPASVVGFERLACDTLDLQTTTNKSTRWGYLKDDGGNSIYLPRIGGLQGSSSGSMVPYAYAVGSSIGYATSNSVANTYPHFLEVTGADDLRQLGYVPGRTTVPVVAKTELTKAYCGSYGASSSILHPATAIGTCTYEFGWALGFRFAGQVVAQELVLPNASAPEWLAFGSTRVWAWALPTIYNL